MGRRQPLDADDPYGAQQDPSRGGCSAALSGNIVELARAWTAPEAWEGTVDLVERLTARPS